MKCKILFVFHNFKSILCSQKNNFNFYSTSCINVRLDQLLKDTKIAIFGSKLPEKLLNIELIEGPSNITDGRSSLKSMRFCFLFLGM